MRAIGRHRLALALAAALAAPAATAADQRITVFNQGAALITEHRELRLEAGDQTVPWPGLPRALLAETLMLDGDGVRLTGYRDSRDLLEPGALLRRLVGGTVTLRRDDGQGGDVERRALLLSADGAPLVRLDGRVEILDAGSPWRIAAEWPETLPQSPSVTLDLRAERGGSRDLALTYQTGGFGWNAAYVARYDDEARRLELRADAVIRNDSGGDWRDAEVILVAGDIERAGGKHYAPAMMRAEVAADSAGGMTAESAFEYYRYRLPEPATLRSGETRSLALLAPAAVEVSREYRIEGGWRRVGDAMRANAAIHLGFENDLDKPMPAGTVRVYDAGEVPQLLGEDRIGHTPEGGPVSLTLGRAFDITAERTVTDEVRDGGARESERRVTVSNAKDEAVKVRIVESLPGDWEIVSQNLPHEKLDANRAAWMVGVPAGGKARLSYRVRWR